MAETPNLALPLIEEGQSGAHVTHNTALMNLDAIVSEIVTRLGAAYGPLGGFLRPAVHEAELTALTGASATATGLIPTRAIVLGVTTKTTADISGATSYKAGLSAGASEFGDLLGVASGSQNIGVVGPFATYGATDVVLTANGSDFAGGDVLVVAHVLELGVS